MNDPTLSDSALRQGVLWSSRARDWAELQEPLVLPAQRRVIELMELGNGVTLLDVGCGAAGALRLAAELGARISGLDAAGGLLEIAQERIPEGEFRLGDITALPWDDDTFDFVVGFNSFQYAEDPVDALHEARRVAKPSGLVGIVVWGSVEECEAVVTFKALGALMPPPPPGSPGPLAGEQRIAEMAEEAGLKVLTDESIDCPWRYPDMTTALRALMSAGPVANFIEATSVRVVEDTLTQCLQEFVQPDGSYLFKNKFRALTARA